MKGKQTMPSMIKEKPFLLFSSTSSIFWLMFRAQLLFLIPCILICIILSLLIFRLVKYLIDYCRKSRQKLTITHSMIINEK